MVTWLIAVIVGLLAGILSGMGIGGGTLLVLYLTAILNMSPASAAGINLLYFLGCAPASLIFHAKGDLINRSVAFWAAVGGGITALIAAMLAPETTPAWLERTFGVLLLIVGIRELWLFFRSSSQDVTKSG